MMGVEHPDGTTTYGRVQFFDGTEPGHYRFFINATLSEIGPGVTLFVASISLP